MIFLQIRQRDVMITNGFQTKTDQDNIVDTLSVSVLNGSRVVLGSHLRSNDTTPNAAAPSSMTNVGAFSALQASTVYDGSGVSRGSVALYQATATASGTASATVIGGLQWSVVSFYPGITVTQSRLVTGNTDSVSASLVSAPSGPVFVMLFTGGDQGVVAAPTPPAGWTQLVFDEKTSQTGYKVRAGIYRGTAQSFAVTLQTGATTNGGWGVLIFEVN